MTDGIIKVPAYSFNIGYVFPEVKGSGPCSTTNAINKTAGLTLAVCYLLSGNKFRGALADLSPQQIMAEMEDGALALQTTVARLFAWADSIMLDPAVTLTEEQMLAVPERLTGIDFSLKRYQRRVAAWMARRMGCAAALGCGTGKTVTAAAAAIAAKRLGFIKTSRCLITAPVNAIGGWVDYIPALRETFDVVDLVSADSLHHLVGLPSEGGALITDEGHKFKTVGRNRTDHVHLLRPKFEWCALLTGSFLHTGCGGVMSMLDLACPGLSRFTDDMVFGAYFNAIINNKVRGRNRRSLGKPAQTNYEKFTQYLLRATISLSFSSAEVASENPLPPQMTYVIETWQKPQWVRDLIEKTWVDAKVADSQLTRETFDANCPVMWGPDCNWQVFTAAVAFAEQFVRENQLIRDMSVIDNVEYQYPADVQKVADTVRRRHLDIRKEVPQPTEEAMEDYRKRREFYNDERKLAGLPSFSALFWLLRTEGNVDRVIVRSVVDKRVIFRYVYAPGTSAENPGYGVKLEQLRQWLIENPDESLFSGAASSQTVDLMIRLMDEMKITYRVIRGGVSAEDRKTFVKEFQSGEFRVFVVQQVAGSESITCTKATTSYLLDHDISPVTYTQYLARTARTGQTEETDHYDLSFTELQTERIHSLRRGEEFDATIRRGIEAAVETAANQNPV